jgi:hypothetical protein
MISEFVYNLQIGQVNANKKNCVVIQWRLPIITKSRDRATGVTMNMVATDAI